MARHVIDVIPGRIALIEAIPFLRHFSPDQPVAEAQGLNLNMEKHQLGDQAIIELPVVFVDFFH